MMYLPTYCIYIRNIGCLCFHGELFRQDCVTINHIVCVWKLVPINTVVGCQWQVGCEHSTLPASELVCSYGALWWAASSGEQTGDSSVGPRRCPVSAGPVSARSV